MPSKSQVLTENESNNQTADKELLHRLLLCSICSNLISQPKQLGSCLHSFCSGCIEKWVVSSKNGNRDKDAQDDKKGVKCPSCDIFSPKCDIENNELLETLLKLPSSKPTPLLCNQCQRDGIEPSWKCSDCKISLCIQCKEMHRNIPILKHHAIEQFLVKEPEENLAVVDNLIFCKEHPKEQLKLNCKLCEEIMCSMCETESHSCHVRESIEDAIKRIMKDLKYSTNQIEKSIHSTQKQFETFQRKIAETKKSYAAKRLTLKGNLDIVIEKLQELKADLEEDLHKEEHEALDELRRWIKPIEKKLNHDRNLIDLLNVCKSKTRHAMLLKSLQCKLYEQVKKQFFYSDSKINFTLPETKIKPVDEISIALSDVFSRIRVCYQSTFQCDTKGTLKKWEQSFQAPYMCKKFDEILNKPFKLEKEYRMSRPYQYRLSYIGEEFWVTVPTSNLVEILHHSGEKTVMKCQYDFSVIKKTYNGYLIGASNEGLFCSDYYVQTQRKTKSSKRNDLKWTQLCPGNFCDISICGKEFATLLYAEDCLTIYRYKFYDMEGDSVWRICAACELNDVESDHLSTLVVLERNADVQYVVATGSERLICIYSQDGICVKQCECQEVPFLCGVDSQGDILVATYQTGKIWLLNQDALSPCNYRQEVSLKKETFPINFTDRVYDVTIDALGNVWCLCFDHRSHNGMKLLKYSLASKQSRDIDRLV